jgi:hypothetical protein
MKNLFLVVLSLLAFLSCDDKDNPLWRSSMVNSSPQIFIIDCKSEAILKGAKGTIIKIDKNSFMDKEGKEVDSVEVSLDEFYSIADFIRNDLSTQTHDGKILRSSGMIIIKAQSNHEEVFLKSGATLKLSFPRVQESRIANLFQGSYGQTDEIRWELLESVHVDTTALQTAIVKKLRYGGAEISAFLSFIIGYDTIRSGEVWEELAELSDREYPETTIYIGEWDSVQLDSSSRLQPKPLQYYIFESSSLGFINCDIFINQELYPIFIQTNKRDARVNIILDSLNSVLYPDSVNETQDIFMFMMPKNLRATAISYAEYGKDTYFNKVQINEDTLKVELAPMNIDDIRKLIETLN